MKILSLFVLFLAFTSAGFAQNNETIRIKLYFLNEKFDPHLEDCTKVHAVERAIPKTQAIAKAALEELFKGVTPEESAKGFVSFSPEETAGILKSVKIKNKAAYINFNKNVYEQMGNATTSCGSGFFSSIEKTLFQFPTIKKVFYAVEGSPRDFYEWVQIGECPKELKNCSGKEFE